MDSIYLYVFVGTSEVTPIGSNASNNEVSTCYFAYLSGKLSLPRKHFQWCCLILDTEIATLTLMSNNNLGLNGALLFEK